ncbi:MAG: thiamine pyrophosphate-binding protein [Firmicutes bacterium]|nr:thiamine pyrophosphate-binding protein [Bacillota bacterium]
MPLENAAKQLVDQLESLNVDTVFGIPGIHNLAIYDQLLDSRIKHITAKHEQGAGFMADGYARVTGKPGVCLVITGPGLTNIATAMGQAYGDSVPMVVISSQVPTSKMGHRTGFLHELKNSTAFAGCIAKESRVVPSKDLVSLYLQEAYMLATSGRPGPVHLEIPMDILSSPVNPGGERQVFDSDHLTLDIWDNFNQHTEMENALKSIQESERPVIIVGGGGSFAAQEITGLAERINAPVLQTCAGKGTVSEDHPLCLGTRLHFPAMRKLLEQSDVAIAIGTELAPTDLWEVPLSVGGSLIHIDQDPANFYNSRPDIALRGDAARIIKALLEGTGNKPGGEEITARVSQIIKKCTVDIPAVTGVPEKQAAYIKEMLGAMRKAFSRDTILCADMTTPAYIALSEFPVYGARTFLHPVGFGTLGHALPAATGIKLSLPEKDVAVLCGDGGFQFTMPELAVGCERGISLPIIIWNDSGFGEIRRWEEAKHPGRRIAVDHKNPDFVELGRAYGIPSCSVQNASELEAAIKEANATNSPYIIEVKATV